ncbi:MAG: hypothetical protein R2761_15345 [Acidimicrobiales bacterium]
MTDGGIDADQVDDLESAADRLYGLDAETFVAARDQLVKALRAGGRRDLAGEVKALRRPTVIAAELNRVLRASPADREALIAAADALAEGQRRLLSGDVSDLAGLQAAHRAAVAILADRAERHQGEVHAALEAASVDEALHPQLHRATFAQEPTPTRGFDLLAAAGLALPAKRPERPPRPAGRSPAPGRRRLPGRRPAPEASPPATPAPEAADPQPAPSGRPSPPTAALRKLQTVPTSKDLELAERRLAAARASEETAVERVGDAEARLAEARRHHEETVRRREAAEAALARLHPDRHQ